MQGEFINLLVVDDEVVTTEVLRDEIDRERLHIGEIYIAYNTAMAKDILETQEIEVVLCDIEMPKESGLDLLEWIRKKQIELEFLFLTSHEKFEYAFGAVKGGAANYLLKPIDMPAINNALFVTAEKIYKKKQMSKAGEYWSQGKRTIVADFWRNTVLEEFYKDAAEIRKEILKWELELDMEKKYSLLILHIRREAVFPKGKDNRLNKFILDNILAETLTESFKMENIIHWEDGGEHYVCVVSDIDVQSTKSRAREVISLLCQFYSQPIYAAYVSEAGKMESLWEMRRKILDYDKEHMCDEGQILFLGELHSEKQKQENIGKILDSKFIFMCLETGERVKLLEYLQKMVASVKKKDKSLINMQYFQMDLLQIVGVYLHKQDRDLEFLFEDSNYGEIQKKSLTSELSMIRWNTYLINKVFDDIKNRKKSDDMVEVLVDYIREHYEEPISRNILAEQVHFSPDYVGKAFKKQMGVSIHDYVNKLRIEKAKTMMLSTNYKIIDIAMMVGFENMPYFSSVFKKYTGCSPAEYKRIHEK